MKRSTLGKTMLAIRRSLNRAGLGKPKVFAVGLNKTGTSSLHALFKSLGLLSYHGPEWGPCDDLRLLRSYDCFSDGRVRDLPGLDRLFPGSKFILQVRELDAWIYSRLAHVERLKPGPASNPSWTNTDESVKHWIRLRNDHHLMVLSYFAQRPSDLLLVNFIRDETATTKICRFLGYEERHDKPHKNANPKKDSPTEHTEKLKRCAAELGVSESELRYDILCPSLLSPQERGQFPEDTSLMIPAGSSGPRPGQP